MRELVFQLHDLDRMLSGLFLNEGGTATAWRPPTDVYETEDSIVIKMEIAGMNPDSFQISFADRILEIRGHRGDTQRKLSCHRLEIPYGEFVSQVYLPGYYEEEHFEADYGNGFLTITLPKRGPEPPHNIAIQSNEKA